MSTKKKAAAKAAVKAVPVRRHKPGPAARAKARAARAELAEAAAAAAPLYTESQRAGVAIASLANGRAAALAGNLSASLSASNGAKLSPAEVEHEQRLADVRLTNARAEAQEIENQRAREERSGNVHFEFKGECATALADELPRVVAAQSLATEQAAFDTCQNHTADLVPRLAARLEQVLKSAPIAGAAEHGKAHSDSRHRSGLADWVGLRTARQADINQALMDLLDRLDIG